MIHEQVTFEILGAFFDVYNSVGYGFVESVYAAAFAVELRQRGIPCTREERFQVHYRQHLVGEFRTDFVVANRVVVELKAVERIAPSHEVQLLNYLRASQMSVGLILNFGPRAEKRRLVWTPARKKLDEGPISGQTVG